MAESMSLKIAKLNNENYTNWKFKMELLLRKQNLWKKVIVGTRPEKKEDDSNNGEIDDWDAKDDEARGIIGLSVEDDQLVHIRGAQTAQQTWNALKNYHEKNTVTNIVHLMRSICSSKLNEGGNARDHINRMVDLFTKLNDLENGLSDKWCAAMLLSSLPKSYDTLVTSLESRKQEEINFALVQQRILAEYDRNQQSNTYSENSVMKVVEKKITCYFCQLPGHMKKNCEKYKRWLEKRGDKKTNRKKQFTEKS